jgi:F-type H+-transporting ATPase subunit alpha
MSMETQVVVIYAVTNGHIDDVPLDKVREWERGYIEYVQAQYPQIADKIKRERTLSKETEAELKQAIAGYQAVVKK